MERALLEQMSVIHSLGRPHVNKTNTYFNSTYSGLLLMGEEWMYKYIYM